MKSKLVSKFCSKLRGMKEGVITRIADRIRGNSSGDQLTSRALLAAPKIQRHHIFPQKFRPFFEQLGINIDDYCIDLGIITHLNGVHGTGNMEMMPGKWNNRWREFISQHPNATTKEVYQFGGQLLDEFGLSHLNLKKYK